MLLANLILVNNLPHQRTVFLLWFKNGMPVMNWLEKELGIFLTVWEFFEHKNMKEPPPQIVSTTLSHLGEAGGGRDLQ